MKLNAYVIAAWLCLLMQDVQASSCREPIIERPDLTKQEVEKLFVKGLFQRLQGRDADQFIIFGQFEKTDDRPLIHVVEHEARMLRWVESGWKEREVSARIEYTYTNIFRCSGFRIMDGKESPFNTQNTIISISVDGEFFRGKVPLVGTPVIGLMRSANPVYFEIDNSPCAGYSEISNERYSMLLSCLQEENCG